MQAKNTFSYVLKIFIPLLLICAVVAGVISGISVLTKDKIAENEAMVEAQKEEKKLAAITEIFGEGVEFTKLSEMPDDIDEIRTATGKDGELLATVTLTVKGYAAGLQVFVAFGDGGEVRRVMVLSSNETTGIGSKVSNTDYLAGYNGLEAPVEFKKGIDKIAGATVSSKAVLGAVNRAAEVYGELNKTGGVS